MIVVLSAPCFGLPYRVGVRFGRGLEPARHGHLLLRVELNAFDALDVQVAEEGLIPTREREPRHRRGDADVDADHAGVKAALEFAGRPAAARKNASAIAIFALSPRLPAESAAAHNASMSPVDGARLRSGFYVLVALGIVDSVVRGAVFVLLPFLLIGKGVSLTRKEMRPFTDKQLELITTFADQAAIARR